MLVEKHEWICIIILRDDIDNVNGNDSILQWLILE